jgi:serine protease Do
MLLGFLLGAVAVLGFREYASLHPTPAEAAIDSLEAQTQTAGLELAQNPLSTREETTEQLHQGRRNAITLAIQKVSPAVLGINVTQVREFRSGNPFWLDDPIWRSLFPERVYFKPVENLGSGFIISADGYVITNEHVVHNATEIVATMTSGEKYTAQVIGADYYSDIALLKIDGVNLPFIDMGNSDSILIGEWAIALGNPFGLFKFGDQPSVTVGVISATNRDFTRTAEGRIYKDMLQTDAAINRGNSGGPLVNSESQIIGMNTFIWTEGGGGSVGIGFAIPINRIKKIVDELKSSGGVNRNYWTGLSIQNLDKMIALSMNLENTDGVIVTDVEPSSPGERAGFQVGDVILAVNQQPVQNYNSVRSYLENEDLRVGDLLKFTVQRDAKQISLNLKLAEMPR